MDVRPTDRRLRNEKLRLLFFPSSEVVKEKKSCSLYGEFSVLCRHFILCTCCGQHKEAFKATTVPDFIHADNNYRTIAIQCYVTALHCVTSSALSNQRGENNPDHALEERRRKNTSTALDFLITRIECNLKTL